MTTDEHMAHLPEILTVQQVAEYLQIALRRAYRLVREEELPSIRIGRMWRVRKSALKHYILNELQYDVASS